MEELTKAWEEQDGSGGGRALTEAIAGQAWHGQNGEEKLLARALQSENSDALTERSLGAHTCPQMNKSTGHHVTV